MKIPPEAFFIDAKIVVHPDKLRYHKNEIQNIGRKKMEKLELIAPCHFGLEAVLKKRNPGLRI